MKTGITIRLLTLLLLASTGIFLACSGNAGDGFGPSNVGIHPSGKESQLNGTWSGSLTGLNYTLVLNDGKVIENWLGSGSMSFHAYGNAGYIGFYSLNADAFEAAMNDSSPGAPLDHVTARLHGTLSGSQLSGTDDQGETFQISR